MSSDILLKILIGSCWSDHRIINGELRISLIGPPFQYQREMVFLSSCLRFHLSHEAVSVMKITVHFERKT
jgi:hypothetical protein